MLATPASTAARRRVLPGWATVAAFALAILAVGAPALLDSPAPVRLAATVPAPGAVLPAAPEAVSLRFTGAVAAVEVHVTVADAAGATVSAAPVVSGSTVTAPLTARGPGPYQVVYHVLLADGRAVAGASRFVVDPAAPPAADPPAAPGASPPVEAEHVHVPPPDPLNVALTAVAALLILALLALLLTRPRLRD
jgi:methionine-rich copper-binding protein CopC